MANNMVKISVIIPVYNAEKYLKNCLDSLINQTLKNIEIICINDGSTDNSQIIIKEFVQKDERVKLFNQPNLGLSRARNKGLEIASGEYIGFVDADDYIDADFYEKLYITAKSFSAEIASGGIIRENEKMHKVLLEYKSTEIADDLSKKFELIKAPKNCFIWNKIYLREKFKVHNINFKAGYFYEDMIFTPLVMLKLGRLITVPEIYYHYRKHPHSVIKLDTDDARADKLYTKKFLNDFIKKQGLNITGKDIIEYKKDYMFMGIKLLKIYKYRATKKFYLFGLLPFMTIKEYV